MTYGVADFLSLHSLSSIFLFPLLFSFLIFYNFVFYIIYPFLCFFHPCHYIQWQVSHLVYSIFYFLPTYFLDLLSLCSRGLPVALVLFSSPRIIMIVVLNSGSGILLISFSIRSMAVTFSCLFFFFYFWMNSSILVFCLGLSPFLCVRKACYVSCS